MAENPLRHVEENIEAVSAAEAQVEHEISRHQRGIELLVKNLGRPRFVYFCVVLAGSWVVGNLMAPRLGLVAFDPAPFNLLQGGVSSVSLLITILILIAQNRQGRLAERRAHLDLQVNLLAESKIAKVISLLEELRRDDPGIRNRYDATAEAMRHPADPQQMVRVLEQKIDTKP